VDAIGVTESDKTDSRPLERKKSVPFDKLVQSIAIGQRDEDTLMTVAGRLAKLNVRLEEDQQKELEAASGGKSVKQIINGLLDAVDPDKQIEKARQIFAVGKPSVEQIEKATEELANEACKPFDDPNFRNALIEIRRQQYQIIDTVSQDAIISVGFDPGKAQEMVETFSEFMEANKDEILALQIIYNQPYDKRHLTYEMIKDLANAMKKPPYNLSSELVWAAFEQLEKDKVKKRRPEHLLTDIISLVRFALGKTDALAPFPDTIDQKFGAWLEEQGRAGNTYTDEQLEWLGMIKDHIATSIEIKVDDFDNVPFYEKGGVMKVYQLFGDRFDTIVEELNEALAA
jgi:type I restriction enzyme R subunit